MKVSYLLASCNNINCETEIIIYRSREKWMDERWSYLGPMYKLTHDWFDEEIDMFWITTNYHGNTRVIIILED